MRTYTFPLIMLMLFVSVYAQDNPVVMKQLVYKETGDQKLTADLFYAEGDEQEVSPALVFFHGGGWISGDPGEFHEACRRYARFGFKVFSIRYRLSVNADGSVPNPDITPVKSTKDARSAMRWVKEN